MLLRLMQVLLAELGRFLAQWGDALAIAIALAIEIRRFLLLRPLGLSLPRQGGYRYPYYIIYLSLCSVLSMATAYLVFRIGGALLDNITRGPTVLAALRGAGALVLVLVPLELLRRQTEHLEKKDGAGRGAARRWMRLGLLLLVLFVLLAVPGTRFLVAGLYFALVSSGLGRIPPFTDWEGLVAKVRAAGHSPGEPDQPFSESQVRATFVLEMQGVLAWRGGREAAWTETAPEGQTLPTLVLAGARLEEIGSLMRRLGEREPFLQEVARISAGVVEELVAAGRAAGDPSPETRDYLRRRLVESLGRGMHWRDWIEWSGEAILRNLPALASIARPASEGDAELPLQKRILSILEKEVDWQFWLERGARAIAADIQGLEDRRTSGKVEEARKRARELLYQAMGRDLRTLLYWRHDIPPDREGMRLYVTRFPSIEMRPLLYFRQYLGLFMLDRQRRRKRG